VMQGELEIAMHSTCRAASLIRRGPPLTLMERAILVLLQQEVRWKMEAWEQRDRDRSGRCIVCMTYWAGCGKTLCSLCDRCVEFQNLRIHKVWPEAALMSIGRVADVVKHAAIQQKIAKLDRAVQPAFMPAAMFLLLCRTVTRGTGVQLGLAAASIKALMRDLGHPILSAAQAARLRSIMADHWDAHLCSHVVDRWNITTTEHGKVAECYYGQGLPSCCHLTDAEMLVQALQRMIDSRVPEGNLDSQTVAYVMERVQSVHSGHRMIGVSAPSIRNHTNSNTTRKSRADSPSKSLGFNPASR